MLEKIHRFLGYKEMDRLQKDILEIIENKELCYRFRNKTILVTGATGLIGSTIIKVFCAANLKYNLAIKIFGQIRNLEKAKEIYGDLMEAQDLCFIMDSEIECDFIIHTVSPTASKYFIQNPVETIKASVGSTMKILDIAKRNNSKVVYLSSMEQYGIPYTLGEKMTEDRIGVINHLNIRSSYSESKRLCECLCASYSAEYGVNVIIARLAQTIGAYAPKSDNRMAIQFARSAVEKKI